MRIRFFKVDNSMEKRLVEATLGYKFEGNQVGIIAGSLDEIKLERLMEVIEVDTGKKSTIRKKPEFPLIETWDKVDPCIEK